MKRLCWLLRVDDRTRMGWKGLREPSMIDGFEVRDLEALIEAVEWMRDGKKKREDEWDNVLGSKDDTER